MALYNFENVIAILIIVIGVYGYVGYIRDTLKGKTKPNRVSWFVWGLAPMIGFLLSIFEGGADYKTQLPLFVSGVMPFFVLLSSFLSRNGYWKLGRLDFVCLGLSVISITFWLALASPLYSLFFAILADIFAATPTIVKCYKYPDTETGSVYIFSIICLLLGFLILKSYEPLNIYFQLYLLVVNIVLVFSVYRKKFFKI